MKSWKSIPFVLIQFPGNDEVFAAMIDTGCEVTLLDSSVMKDIDGLETIVIDNNLSMSGFGGSVNMSNCIKFSTDVMFCDESCNDIAVNIHGIVSSFSSQGLDKVFSRCGIEYRVAMVIGSSTLKGIKGTVDYKRRRLVIVDEEK